MRINEPVIEREESEDDPLFAPKSFWQEVFDSMIVLILVSLALLGTEQFCLWLIRIQGR